MPGNLGQAVRLPAPEFEGLPGQLCVEIIKFVICSIPRGLHSLHETAEIQWIETARASYNEATPDSGRQGQVVGRLGLRERIWVGWADLNSEVCHFRYPVGVRHGKHAAAKEIDRMISAVPSELAIEDSL